MSDFLTPFMIEAAEVLEQITGLQVFAHPPEKINPPGGAVSYPDKINYGKTYGGRRGVVELEGINIVLVANRATSVDARDTVAGWVATSGDRSVPRLLETHEWEACDFLRVTDCTFDVVTIGAVDYLAAMFKATAMISGGN